MAPVSITGEVLPESKNTVKGKQCEAWALEHYLTQGYELISERKRYAFAEVDLLFRKQNVMVLVEVKSVTHEIYKSYRLGARQKAKLSQCLMWIAERWNGPVELHLALVKGPGEVEIIEDIF